MQRSTWLVALIMMAAAFMMLYYQKDQQTLPADPAVMLQKAQDNVVKAGKNKKKLGAALNQYEQAAKKVKSEDSARALVEVGDTYAQKLRDNKSAVRVYKEVATIYSPETSAAAAQAKQRAYDLEKRDDVRNSRHTLYKVMDTLVNLTGRNPAFSYALALIFITAIFKIITAPLSRAQYKSMKEMQKIQPLMKQLQEKYKGDQKTIGEKTMALYKEHGVNPFASCLPLLVQMPVLWLLYYMVQLYQFQFSNGHFLWIGSSLASQYPAFLGRSLAEPDIPLLLLYTVSMYISQKLTVVDPSQAEQQKIMSIMMPVMFAFLFKGFMSAFILYWLFFNIFSTVQQYYALKQPSSPTDGGQGTTTGGTSDSTEAGSGIPARTAPARSRRRRKRFDALPLRRPQLMPNVSLRPDTA